MKDSIISRWRQRHAESLPWNIKVGDRFVVKVPDMEAYHRRIFMKGEKSEPTTLRAIIPEGMSVRVTGVAESWNEIEFSTGDMCSVPDPDRKITIRTGIGFFAKPDAFARAVGLGSKKPEVYYFRMDNQPGNPWRPYYVLWQHTDEDEVAFTSIPPDQMQYQAEHFRLDRADLDQRLSDGSIRREMPQKVDQVLSVNPDDEFDRLIKLRDEGNLTPEQFQEKAKRLFGMRLNWMLRRAALNIEESAPKAFESYKRDRGMGLDHAGALDHAIGNWSMIVNLRRQMNGEEPVPDTEIAALRQRVEQMIANEGGGGTKPDDWVIAHIMPLMTRTAKDAKRDFSCVMVNVVEPEVKKAFEAIVASIPDEDIYDPPGNEKYGREDRPHVTVKYGLHTNEVDDVRALIEGFGPIEATIKGVSFFRKEGKDYDVLKFDIESEDLARLREKIEGALPSTDEHPVYHPHMTVAYLRRGTAEKYSGDTEFASKAKEALDGTGLVFSQVCFSDKDSQKVEIKCVKTASGFWRLHMAKAKHSPAYEKETAIIRENKKKPEAKEPHDFKPAKWTHPNGHPRCITCGDEERIGGRCNVEPTEKDFADFEKKMDAEFPDRVERRKKEALKLGALFERGEITHTDLCLRMAMTDETERLLASYWSGDITKTDLDAKLRLLRTA